jgi:hypothetical protein
MNGSLAVVLVALIAGCGSSPATSTTNPGSDDCRTCVDPDSPECAGCLGAPTKDDSNDKTPNAAPDQIAISEAQLSFAIIGDTRPASVDDTAGYPTAIITTIFQDLQNTNPRPGFAVGTGDYQFSSNGSTTTGPQLDLYLQAQSSFSNPEYPTMGNHECTGFTRSNCGPGTTDGLTSVYNTYVSKILTPMGIHNPYYSLLVTPPNNAWSAKIVVIAANAWTTTQASWLDTVLSQPTTYTFVVRHEGSSATTAPGVSPSGTILKNHPYTMLIAGHTHTYKRVSQKEILVGNGGAPLTSGSAYGYGIVSQRSDGAIQFTIFHYKTHAVLDSFAVNADGSTATGTPPPGTFSIGATPATVTSNGASATSTIKLTPLTGFSGTANLAATGTPTGAMASFASSSIGANQSTTLSLSPGTASPGTYDINVSGTDGSETESTSVTWTIAGATTCSHDLCTTGTKLASSCDPCVTQICNSDSACCTSSWTSTCVSDVASVCGLNTCGSGTSCAHAICSTGAKLAKTCDACVTQICTKDSFCCSTDWDSACVAEVGTICGETCN